MPCKNINRGEGCPILRQIYAWHCIVLTLNNNTVQKHNNKERSKTIRNLTMPCINLSDYWTSVTEGPGVRDPSSLLIFESHGHISKLCLWSRVSLSTVMDSYLSVD